jgi:hypothetical protein
LTDEQTWPAWAFEKVTSLHTLMTFPSNPTFSKAHVGSLGNVCGSLIFRSPFANPFPFLTFAAHFGVQSRKVENQDAL